ncbi:MAG: hypothetical protein U1E27_14195, partial [Kiritimatiellia bacterium]|nr:hypothetical protein [Kiritimatiellia bacterium]
MKILPPTRTRTRPAAQVEHLAAWLREWQIDRQLPHPAPERAPFRPRIGGRRIPLRPGEIRLLRPESETAAERPIYLAVLELDEGTGDARAFPFSRFTCPAVPGEIRISGPIPALRVLCCWNELRPDRERLERAWPVSELDPADCFAALQLLASPAAGTPSDSPPERLLDRVGPPLL